MAKENVDVESILQQSRWNKNKLKYDSKFYEQLLLLMQQPRRICLHDRNLVEIFIHGGGCRSTVRNIVMGKRYFIHGTSDPR